MPEGGAAFVGDNGVELLQGGDELFPAMHRAMAAAQRQVWLATYIFHDDESGQSHGRGLARGGARVASRCMWSSTASARWPRCRRCAAGWPTAACSWTCSARSTAGRPGCSRRSCAGCTRSCAWSTMPVAFVGGINIIDDRNDLSHGRSEQPRLDFAVELRGPVVLQVQHLVQSLVARARLGHEWRSEVGALARSRQPVADTLQLLRELRSSPPPGALPVRHAAAGARGLRGARQPAPAARHRTPLHRSRAHRAPQRRHRLSVLLPAPRLQAQPARGGPARRARAPAAAGQGRLSAGGAGGARALRRVAVARRAHLRVHARLPACQGGGGRRRLGHGGQLQHRPAVAAAQPGSQRRGAGRELRAAAAPAARRSPSPYRTRSRHRRCATAGAAGCRADSSPGAPTVYLRVAGIAGRY